MSLGLLFLNYRDAIKEGDGQRVMLCWKYFLPIFKATNRQNYAIEAFITLANCKVLPPRQAHQLIWSRFVNARGLPGHNILYDLYIEHLNRMLKECVQNLRANKTSSAILRASRCLGPLSTILHNFDKEVLLGDTSIEHTVASSLKDHDLVIKELREKAKVFGIIPGRCHPSFPNFTCNPTRKLKREKLCIWLQQCAKARGYTLL